MCQGWRQTSQLACALPFSFGGKVLRVPNSFSGIRDLAYFKAGIRDFEGTGVRDSGL